MRNLRDTSTMTIQTTDTLKEMGSRVFQLYGSVSRRCEEYMQSLDDETNDDDSVHSYSRSSGIHSFSRTSPPWGSFTIIKKNRKMSNKKSYSDRTEAKHNAHINAITITEDIVQFRKLKEDMKSSGVLTDVGMLQVIDSLMKKRIEELEVLAAAEKEAEEYQNRNRPTPNVSPDAPPQGGDRRREWKMSKKILKPIFESISNLHLEKETDERQDEVKPLSEKIWEKRRMPMPMASEKSLSGRRTSAIVVNRSELNKVGARSA